MSHRQQNSTYQMPLSSSQRSSGSRNVATTTTNHHHQRQQQQPSPPKPVSALTLLRRNRHNTLPKLFLLRHPLASATATSDARLCSSSSSSSVDNDKGDDTAPPFGQIGLGITEIAGMAGSGKTQLALGLCVSCASTPYGPSASTSSSSSGTPAKRPLTNVQSTMDNSNNVQTIRNPYSSLKHTHTTAPTSKNNGNGSNKPNVPSCSYYKALYISMGEGCTPTQIAHRLKQMSNHRQSPPSQAGGSTRTNNNNNVILSRVLTRFIRNTDEFESLIQKELPTLLEQSHTATTTSSGNNSKNNTSNPNSVAAPIGLVVMDSIGGLFRTQEHQYNQQQQSSSSFQQQQPEQNKSFILQRSTILLRTASKLKELSETYQVPMVVINQVTSSFGNDSGTGNWKNDHYSSTTKLVPSLGILWSNCVNTSYIITRNESTISSTILGGNHTHHQQQQQQSTNIAATSSTNTSTRGSSRGSNTPTQTRFLRTARVRLSSSQCTQSSVKKFKIDLGGPIAIE